MSHESFINFLGVGAQLLPVFWILLAVETTWLRSTVASPTTTRADRAFLRVTTIPLGAVAEIVALAALLHEDPMVVTVAGYLLLAALVFSISNAGLALTAAVHQRTGDRHG